MDEHTNFLTRLAERTLGLAPTVQPMIAPMYAPGQQMVGEKAQSFPPHDRVSDDVSFGDLDEQVAYPQRSTAGMLPQEGPQQAATRFTKQGLPSLVPQIDQPSIIQSRGERPGVRLVPGRLTSLVGDAAEPLPGQVSAFSLEIPGENEPVREGGSPEVTTAVIVALSGEQDRGSDQQPGGTMEVLEDKEVDGRATTGINISARNDGRPQGSPTYSPPPLRVDARSIRGPGWPQAAYRKDARQVTHLEHHYNRVDQHEIAPITQESSAPAPTIQVTIGRIEVRATPPPTPRSQPQRSGPPVMGLEEYLKQRAQGGHG